MADSTIKDLQNQAKTCATLAGLFNANGDVVIATQYYLRAALLESNAAQMLPAKPDNEPSRSLLFLSAALYAKKGGDYQKAKELCFEGLAGYPRLSIRQEFESLLEKIRAEISANS